jgi:ssDNA-binding replication factor A large subunit
MDDNYERLLKKIAESSGLSKEELEKKVEEKKAKLAGLITKDGAMQIIANELGVCFDNEKLKLNELIPGMRQVNVTGKIINLFPVRTFKTKKGEESKVVNLILADDTSNNRVVLWDTNHIELIENGNIQNGSVVDIFNGSMRDNEIHLGNLSELKLSEEVLDNVKTEKIFNEKNIADLKVGENANLRAFIVQAFEPKFFHVCNECRKKVVAEGDGFSCAEHGKVPAEKRALISIVLDDGTENFNAVLFHENLPLIGLTELENQERLNNQKQDILGKEMIFSGNIRMNKFFNRPELIVEKVKDVNIDELIEKLNSK